MTVSARLTDRFRQLAERQGVHTLSYFHCDHFEPWRWQPDVMPINERNGQAVVDYAEAMTRGEHSKRLTLFLKSPYSATVPGRRKLHLVPGDEIGFRPISPAEAEIVGHAAHGLLSAGHAIELHIHHERFTRNEHHSTSPDLPMNAPFRDFLDKRSTPEMDEARLRLHIDLTLDLYRAATGLPFDRWFFVHGMWALNGSDRDYCCVDREIELLQSMGCLGDFTFPAGRSHCDPQATAPFLCRPVAKPKGYDLPEAEAVRAIGQPGRGRFLIWASAVTGKHCSIDTYGKAFEALAGNVESWADALVDGAVIADGRLYLKTHAHSMRMGYYDNWDAPAWPHHHPAVMAVLDLLFDSAAQAGLSADYPTVAEVYDRFVAPTPASVEAAEAADFGEH